MTPDNTLNTAPPTEPATALENHRYKLSILTFWGAVGGAVVGFLLAGYVLDDPRYRVENLSNLRMAGRRAVVAIPKSTVRKIPDNPAAFSTFIIFTALGAVVTRRGFSTCRCQHCHSVIRREATVCRHCNRNVSPRYLMFRVPFE